MESVTGAGGEFPIFTPMPLLALMYHRARAGRHGNLASMLDRHLGIVAERFGAVSPGQSLRPGSLNICLTFDDAYFDFYAIVLPLLEKHRLHAVLAVPTGMIVDHAGAPRARRIEMSSDEAFAAPALGGFCTWTELREIAASGRVTIAAHGHTHCRLDAPDVDLESEVERPLAILKEKLGVEVTSFVFPYGRFTGRSRTYAAERYRYLFRIGGALNRNWNSRVIYRVTADELTSADEPFRLGNLVAAQARSWWNRLRLR